MKTLDHLFAQRFERWGISIPEEHAADRRPGRIRDAGWTIWFLYGEEGDGEFLDFYASHRMTDDEHTRLFADGREEALPCFATLRLSSRDPIEDLRLEREHFAQNQRVTALLAGKGFLAEADDDLAVLVKRQLLSSPPSD